jgi:hypothetical protein
LAYKKAELNINAAKAFRPPSGKGSGAGGPKPNYDIDTAAMIDKVVDLKRDPKADPNEIKALEDKIAGRTGYKKTIRDLGPEKQKVEENKLEVTTQAKAADAWEGMSRRDKKDYAIKNGIVTGVANPGWVAQAGKIHNQNFGKKTTGGSTVINFDANGQPIQ